MLQFKLLLEPMLEPMLELMLELQLEMVDMLTGSSLDGRILTQTACNLQSATISP